MSLQPGVRLGPYEIHSAIGAGGMGEVYRATDTNLGRQVAIKVLPEALAQDADRLARFEREARTLGSLNHPNIAIIHGLERSHGTDALVMELVEGPTLADRIADGPVPLEEALSIARQIADALEAAHEHGIVHRDLKPANIKVRADGTVKVLDFGLAKALGPEPGQRDLSLSPTITSPVVTGPTVILGTAAYMAPEQAAGRVVDKRSDIWAFGVVLYEMLSGRSPFAAETTVEVLSRVLQADPDWTALPPTTPAPIRSLLKRCLQRDRARRLRDIADARFQIEEAISDPAAPLATGVAAQSATNRERWFWVAALVAVASVAAGMAGYLRQPPVQPDEVRLEINTPPTTAPTSMAISPDGRALVFAAISSGKEQLWVRSLDAPSARPLAGTDGARYPFWSPDSRSVGFFADAQLKRIDVESAAVQTLASAEIPLGGAWSVDDTIFFTPGPSSPLSRVASTGGQLTQVTQLTAEAQNHRFPQILPDGSHILYYATGTAPGIYVSRLDGSEPRRLLEADSAAYSSAGHLLFQRQGVLFAQAFDLERLELTGRPITLTQQVVAQASQGVAALSASAAGPIVYRSGRAEAERQLVWFDRSGKELQRVPGSNWAGGTTVSLSPDGRTVAYDQRLQGTTDIWLLELARGVSARFTSHPEFELYPAWSPDGKRIAFQSNRKSAVGTTFDTYVKSVRGTANEELLVGGERGQIPTDWSLDGRFVLYTDTTRGIWAVSPDGDRKPFPVVEINLASSNGQFSPDGNWIAYQSLESGPRAEIFVQRFPGPGGKTRISSGGGVQPRWRRNGKELFYLSPDNRLMAVPITLDSARDEVKVGPPVPLFAASLSGSQGGGNRQYMVSADGQRFLLDTPAEVTMPITVVLNWKAGIE